MSFTPGPWRVAPAADYGDSELNVDAGKRGYICLAGHRGDQVAEANARLIAQAPAMLHALEITAGNIRSLGPAGAAQVYTPYQEWLAMIENLIAKARGETSPDMQH